MVLTQTAGMLRALEQEEPFDLSQKRGAKAPAFQSDGESARGSSCHEEEDEDPCFEGEQGSPGLAPRSRRRCASQEPSQAEPDPGAREEALGEQEAKPMGTPPGMGRGSLVAEGPSRGALLSARRGSSFSDYLDFKHRDENLKELLERKMEKPAVLLGI